MRDKGGEGGGGGGGEKNGWVDVRGERLLEKVVFVVREIGEWG